MADLIAPDVGGEVRDCLHGVLAMRNGDHWLHVVTMSRCVPSSDVEMTHHHVIRDGSFWLCRHCGRTWAFPSPVPRDTAPCTPRSWGVA